jgi:DNA-binding NtrC family response regulator
MDDAAVNPSLSAGWKSYGILGERPIRPSEQVTMTSDKPNSVSTLAVSTPAATRTILIVDDDPSVTETFERMLRLEGYHVVTALSAEAGLSQAERAHPHAIILDLRMPLVDGLQFLRTLRSKEELSKMPVAIVTGDYFLDDAVSRELRGLGAEVRFKPLWLEDLLALARNLLKA